MKRIITLSLLAAIISVFCMSVSAQYTYRTSYYKGTLSVDFTSMGMAKTSLDDQYVSITPTTPGYCTLGLHDFNFGGVNFGDIIIENAQLSDGDDGGFNISASKDDMSLADGTITADVTCQGTLDVDGNINLTIDISYSDVTIPVTFSGAYADLEGICDVTTDTSAEPTYYTIDGVMVPSESVAHGIYIKCQGSKSSKVIR